MSVPVTSLGNGEYVLKFNPKKDFDLSITDELELKIDFSDGDPHTAFVEKIKLDGSDENAMISTTTTGNNQASIDFSIASATGKGYTVLLYLLGDGAGFAPYANVNYNSMGVNLRGLTNGETYFAYLEYKDGSRSGIVMVTPAIK